MILMPDAFPASMSAGAKQSMQYRVLFKRQQSQVLASQLQILKQKEMM